jgi:hypothetical protein
MQTAQLIQLSALNKLLNKFIVWILKTQERLFITIIVQKILRTKHISPLYCFGSGSDLTASPGVHF